MKIEWNINVGMEIEYNRNVNNNNDFFLYQDLLFFHARPQFWFSQFL